MKSKNKTFNFIDSLINPNNPMNMNKEKNFYACEEIKKIIPKKKYDPWAYGFNIDMTNGYNRCIDDIFKLFKKLYDKS